MEVVITVCLLLLGLGVAICLVRLAVQLAVRVAAVAIAAVVGVACAPFLLVWRGLCAFFPWLWTKLELWEEYSAAWIIAGGVGAVACAAVLALGVVPAEGGALALALCVLLPALRVRCLRVRRLRNEAYWKAKRDQWEGRVSVREL